MCEGIGNKPGRKRKPEVTEDQIRGAKYLRNIMGLLAPLHAERDDHGSDQQHSAGSHGGRAAAKLIGHRSSERRTHGCADGDSGLHHPEREAGMSSRRRARDNGHACGDGACERTLDEPERRATA